MITFNFVSCYCRSEVYLQKTHAGIEDGHMASRIWRKIADGFAAWHRCSNNKQRCTAQTWKQFLFHFVMMATFFKSALRASMLCPHNSTNADGATKPKIKASRNRRWVWGNNVGDQSQPFPGGHSDRKDRQVLGSSLSFCCST